MFTIYVYIKFMIFACMCVCMYGISATYFVCILYILYVSGYIRGMAISLCMYVCMACVFILNCMQGCLSSWFLSYTHFCASRSRSCVSGRRICMSHTRYERQIDMYVCIYHKVMVVSVLRIFLLVHVSQYVYKVCMYLCRRFCVFFLLLSIVSVCMYVCIQGSKNVIKFSRDGCLIHEKVLWGIPESNIELRSKQHH